ncbi:MAG: hypothetical protein AB7O04_00085 [Hyphomonadaceae bacterium]
MFERATASLIAISATCAAAALAVFAAGFALYALALSWLPPAGAAAIVAAVAAGFAGATAWLMRERAERRRLQAEAEGARMLGALPAELAGFLADRPIATLAVSLVGGLVAARNPTLLRDLLAAFTVARR